MQRLVSLIRSCLFIFCFFLGDWPKETLLWLRSESSAMFSSRSFMMSCLVFRSLSHFEFIFCMVWACVLTSLICMQLSNFPNNHLLKRPSFLHCVFHLLCRRSVDCRCVCLFLDLTYILKNYVNSTFSLYKNRVLMLWCVSFHTFYVHQECKWLLFM